MNTKCKRGGNSIPVSVGNEQKQPGGIISEIKLDKRILWDWVSYTFDTLEYHESFIASVGKKFVTIAKTETNDEILNTLLFVLGVPPPVDWSSIEQDEYAINNFKFSITIGEFIEINFAGPRSANDRMTTQILLRGQACRELVEFRRRDSKYPFVELFAFCRALGGHFKRADLAIDDFTGKEIDIYDLEEFVDNKWFTATYQGCMKIKDLDYRGGIFSKGFSLTFGSPKSNQLQIYDKNLERKSQNFETFGTNVWYRYEMRFVDDKADQIVEEYMKVMTSGDEDPFRVSRFAMEALNGCITFKDPEQCSKFRKKNPKWTTIKDKISDAVPLPEWLAFTETVKKTDLRSHGKVEKSIDRTEKWMNKSLLLIFAELFLTYQEDYLSKHLLAALVGLERMDDPSLEAVNKKRESLGKKRITMQDVQEKHDELIGKITRGNIRVVLDDLPF